MSGFLWIFNGYKNKLNKVLESIHCTIRELNCRFPGIPEITLTPANLVSCGAGEFTITATVSGCDNTYQWQESIEGNWVDIEGETDLVLSIELSDIGEYLYRIKVTQCNANILYSEDFTLEITEVNFAVYLALEFDSICSGGSTNIYSELAPDPGGTTTYQWQISDDVSDWSDIDGATDAIYLYQSDETDTEINKYFRLIATNSGCSALSESATLIVFPDPEISASIENSVLCEGGTTATHSEVVGGTGISEYQWQYFKDGEWIDITGATNADFVLDNAPDIVPAPLPVGEHSFRVLLTQNSGCSAVSNEVSVTVIPAFTAEIVTADSSLCTSQSFELTINVTPDPGVTLEYTWSVNPNQIEGWQILPGTEVGNTLTVFTNIIQLGVGTHDIRGIAYTEGCYYETEIITITIESC